MSEDITLGIYEHYRGKRYEVICIARHSETLEKLVVYKALYNSKDFENNSIWVRPLEMFKENVIFNYKEVPRFKLIKEI